MLTLTTASTIVSAGIQNTLNAGFSVLSTSCTVGRVLLPNDSCEIRSLFRAPSGPSTTSATAFINFSAADSPSVRSVTMLLEARTGAALPGDGETQFKNGFEFAMAQCLE